MKRKNAILAMWLLAAAVLTWPLTSCGSDDDGDDRQNDPTERDDSGQTGGDTPDEDEKETDDDGPLTAVDLGLSVKWADRNVGADNRRLPGTAFAWGETQTKETFGKDNYFDPNYTTVDTDICGIPQYDAATASWDDGWRMPTKEDVTELKEKCTITTTELRGTPGMEITGPNGNTIFIPYTETADNGSLRATVWTGTVMKFPAGMPRYSAAYFARFTDAPQNAGSDTADSEGDAQDTDGSPTIDDTLGNWRYLGLPIRAVKD